MTENLSARIRNYFPDEIFSLLQLISRQANKLNYRTYLVGGIVRDLLLQRGGLDIDVLVEGDAGQLASSLSELLNIPALIHKKFGTATIKYGIYRIDLASCRGETYRYQGALPDIYPGTLKEDLSRRDFTVNSMAICLDNARFGDLIDIQGGLSDLKGKLIRILHNKSFQDDATRIMRSIRYEQRLDFHIESNTLQLLHSDLDMLDTISGDRLRHELILWLQEPEPEKIILRANQLGVLRKLHPSLSADKNLHGLFISLRNDTSSGSLPSNYLAIIIHNLSTHDLQEFLIRLNIQGGSYHRTTTQTLALKDNLHKINSNSLKPSEIYFFLKDFDIAAIRANSLMSVFPAAQANLKLYLDKLRNTRIRINGDCLINMGISEGQQIGSILNSILTARLNGQISTLTEEKELAQNLVSQFSAKRMNKEG